MLSNKWIIVKCGVYVYRLGLKKISKKLGIDLYSTSNIQTFIIDWYQNF